MRTHAPPGNAKSGPARPPHANNEFTWLMSHGLRKRTSAIPHEWLREGARLVAAAERSQQARYWRAAAIHFAGILARTGEKL
jgi:hypothetical protein